VEPGATVRAVNARLARHGRKLGPDPASESACTIGGVVANNSSGMACGTEFNTYRTLESVVLVLPSGTVIDTGAPDSDEQLRPVAACGSSPRRRTRSTRASLWQIRKGLYTAVAGARPSGTTALLEDIAVPVERQLPTCTDLTGLFDRHDYTGP